MNFGELILNEPLVKCFASTTPETDSETNYCDAIPDMPWVDVEVARKLERERDEARDQRNRLHELHNQNAIHHNELLELCVTLRKERDEAQNASEAFSALAWKLERERNEAREQWKRQNEALITLALHGDAEIQRLTKERDEARELAEAYKEYAQLLGAEINDMVIHAHVHGLKFSRFEQGKVLHEKIKQLEKKK